MTDYLNYLDAAVAGFQKEAQDLQLQDRADEANIVKIKINVCGICKTVYEALQRATPPEQFERTYLAKLRQLENIWKEAYDKAEAHEDAEKLLIEQSKLKTLQKNKLQYLELRGRQHAGS